jgi:hypothetical protein
MRYQVLCLLCYNISFRYTVVSEEKSKMGESNFRKTTLNIHKSANRGSCNLPCRNFDGGTKCFVLLYNISFRYTVVSEKNINFIFASLSNKKCRWRHQNLGGTSEAYMTNITLQPNLVLTSQLLLAVMPSRAHIAHPTKVTNVMGIV